MYTYVYVERDTLYELSRTRKLRESPPHPPLAKMRTNKSLEVDNVKTIYLLANLKTLPSKFEGETTFQILPL